MRNSSCHRSLRFLSFSLLAGLGVAGCFVDRSGLLLDGGARDAGRDSATGCPTGRVDLDGDPSNGCECIIGVEICNGADEDCDGIPDQGVTRTCGPPGACAGIETCTAGSYGDCVPIVAPPDEMCDGTIDDDCDGRVDEGCDCTPAGSSEPCGATDVGVCELGTQTCQADGTFGDCIGEITARMELCDGVLDENCDGTVDDGCMCVTGMTRPCPGGSSVGECEAGTETCNAAGAWGSCVGAVGPAGEFCEGSLDENCDGRVDEDCECLAGTSTPCGTSVGACSPGTQTCSATGRLGTCMGGVSPGTETCNAVDDDCNGVIDDDGTADCATATGCSVDRLGSGTYLFCDTNRSWTEARGDCAFFGYHLVTINGGTENGRLETRAAAISGGDWWIGHNDEDGDGTFSWVFMSSSYDNYRGGEPDTGECGLLDTVGMDWESRGCAGGRRFICEAP